MAQAVSVKDNGVAVADGFVYITSFSEQDADVVRVVSEADDAVEATHQCLQIGARAIRVAHVSVDSDIVDKRFEQLAERMDEGVDAAVAQFTDVATSLLDPDDGTLAVALQSHAKEFEELLGATFDANSKLSVFGVLEEVLVDARSAQVEEIRKLVSADGEDSPIAVASRAVVRSLREEIEHVRKDVHDLSEKIAVSGAVAEVYDLTSKKGFDYEDIVEECLAEIAAPHGDTPERVSKQHGEAGTDKGDLVVHVNRDDVHGAAARFVVEAKSKKLGRRATDDEICAAIANRGALAGMAVFADQSLAPTKVPFSYTDNRAIVVLDKDGDDRSALHLAYMWARWVVRRSLNGAARDTIDHERIAALIDDANKALTRAMTIKRNHTSAKKCIDDAAAQVLDLVEEVREALADIASELDEGQPHEDGGGTPR
jgi:hypothetical protein